MPSNFPNADASANNRAGLGPMSKFNMSEAEAGLAGIANIQQNPEADEHGDRPLRANNTELASDRPTDIGPKQPRPDRGALFRDALSRMEKLIHPIGSPKPICGPLPDEEMPDLSNNIFWLADQRRRAEQLSIGAPSTEGSASGDASHRPPSPRPALRTPPPEPERTPTPPHTPYSIRKARLIMQMAERFGPDWNPVETDYGCPPSESESDSECDDDGVKDPYRVRTMRDFATEAHCLDRSKSCPPCFSCDCAEAKAAKLRLAGKAELEEYERAPFWWWKAWCDTDRIIRRDF